MCSPEGKKCSCYQSETVPGWLEQYKQVIVWNAVNLQADIRPRDCLQEYLVRRPLSSRKAHSHSRSSTPCPSAAPHQEPIMHAGCLSARTTLPWAATLASCHLQLLSQLHPQWKLMFAVTWQDLRPWKRTRAEGVEPWGSCIGSEGLCRWARWGSEWSTVSRSCWCWLRCWGDLIQHTARGTGHCVYEAALGRSGDKREPLRLGGKARKNRLSCPSPPFFTPFELEYGKLPVTATPANQEGDGY